MEKFHELERLRYHSTEPYVIVTGFEPFGKVTVNPSWQAAQKLQGQINGVRILAFEIPVVYSDAEQIVPLLHKSLQRKITNKPLFILHIGASGQKPRCFMRFESRAHGTGYHNKRDNHGQCPAGGLLRLPTKIVCGPRKPVNFLPVNNDLSNRLCHTLAKNSDSLGNERHIWSVELSDNAGRYLCEYVFHLSLRCSRIAAEWKSDQVPVNFLHVPIVDDGSKENDEEKELLDQADVDEAVFTIVTCMIHELRP